MTPVDGTFFDAVENLRQELHVIRQQLRLYAELTIQERAHPLTITPEAFSASMARLADQVEAAMKDVESFKEYTT